MITSGYKNFLQRPL